MDAGYKFRIANSFTPETLPMERLAEYMGALARLLGEPTNVHFEAIEKGSAVLRARVDDPAQPKVGYRLRAVRNGEAPADAAKAFNDLDELLREDNATGDLRDPTGAIIIPFPGRDKPKPAEYGPIRQEGSVDGQVIRVGGKDATVPVHLREGATIHTGLTATPELAREIAHHLFGPPLRVHGTGTWYRESDGCWSLRGFRIESFEVLTETSLLDVIAAVQKVPGSEWNKAADPVAALLAERSGEGSSN